MVNVTADQSPTVHLDGDLGDIAHALASVQGEIQDAVNWVDSAFGTANSGRPKFQPVAVLKAFFQREQANSDDVAFELSAERA